MKNCIKKICVMLAILFSCTFTFILINPLKAHAATAKVVLEFNDGKKMTWKTGDAKLDIKDKKIKYVYFGNYPQKMVTNSKLKKTLKKAKYNSNNITTVNGVKYKRISVNDIENGFYFNWKDRKYAYFKVEPIKWQVLYGTDGKLLLLSVNGLDDKKYNDNSGEITWADSSIRAWLNNEFKLSAFNKAERKLISTSYLDNSDNPDFKVEAGKNTKDKVFLLSAYEVVRPDYGFETNKSVYDSIRECTVTKYASAKGSYRYETESGKLVGNWFLRTPGINSESVATVGTDAFVYENGSKATDLTNTVRPAINFKISEIVKGY